MKYKLIATLLLFVVIATAGCTSNQGNNTSNNMSMTLVSSAFSDNENIPVKYTASADSISPPLSWSNAPANTKSFAIICQDPDSSSGDFTHWIIFNIPADTTQINESTPRQGTLVNGAKQGKNDLGTIGYTGPDPPSGIHHYVFKVYALDQMLNLNEGTSKSEFQDAINGHILAQGKLTGIYGK